MKILFLILFLVINFNFKLFAQDEVKEANLVILDKTSSTKYDLVINGISKFRSLEFELLSCQDYKFEKYSDQIALLKINSKVSSFTGWFFSKTEELNTFSDKIYEISLINCLD